jgi:hypothetical protein
MANAFARRLLLSPFNESSGSWIQKETESVSKTLEDVFTEFLELPDHAVVVAKYHPARRGAFVLRATGSSGRGSVSTLVSW